MQRNVLLAAVGFSLVGLVWAADPTPEPKPLPDSAKVELLQSRLAIDQARDAVQAKAPQEYQIWVGTQQAFQVKVQDIAKKYCPGGQITNDLKCLPSPAENPKKP